MFRFIVSLLRPPRRQPSRLHQPPSPQTAQEPPRLTMAQALDISLRRGYNAVNWGLVV